jgi:hypothetical protein
MAAACAETGMETDKRTVKTMSCRINWVIFLDAGANFVFIALPFTTCIITILLPYYVYIILSCGLEQIG